MKPNFLIFMTDQQRGDMQPTFGKAKMPNLERLAENGVVFRRAYCPSPHCCPSRATFFLRAVSVPAWGVEQCESGGRAVKGTVR